MKLLSFALTLTACNFGLVDVKENHKTCYDLNYNFNLSTDSVTIDSTAYECGSKTVTTPFEVLIPKQ